MRSFSLFLVALVVVGGLSGCGGPSMAPVKGRVMWKGKPVKEAQLTFSPQGKSADDKEPGKPGTGFTDDEGYYVLSTYRAEDGAHIGEHKVTIMVDDTNKARCKRLTQLKREVKSGANDFEFDLE
jgi:hypothetical protein